MKYVILNGTKPGTSSLNYILGAKKEGNNRYLFQSIFEFFFDEILNNILTNSQNEKCCLPLVSL